MTVRLAVAAAMALGLAGSAGGAADSMSGWFFVAGKQIYCGTELYPHEPGRPTLMCWRPRNGFVLLMGDTGHATAQSRRGFIGHRPPTGGRLAVGERAWVSRDRRIGRGAAPRRFMFHCRARPNWLVCRNGAGYGWRFARERGWQFIVHG